MSPRMSTETLYPEREARIYLKYTFVPLTACTYPAVGFDFARFLYSHSDDKRNIDLSEWGQYMKRSKRPECRVLCESCTEFIRHDLLYVHAPRRKQTLSDWVSV